jgi:hypothetical protein
MISKITYLLIPILLTSMAILIISIAHFNIVVAQSNKQTGGSLSNQSRAASLSNQGHGIPGPQENANPLAQAPITGIKVRPPNNASIVSPLQKTNMTSALP